MPSLREIWDKVDSEGTIRQRRKVRRVLAAQDVPVLLHVTGGEFLELADAANAAGTDVPTVILERLRRSWKADTGFRLGWPYEVRDDVDTTVTLGETLKESLGLLKKGST